MRAGRVPVIISDDWVRPKGPKWDSFSLSIRENEVGIIPDVLKKYENQVAKLGTTARKEWEAWYSKDVVFTTVVDQLILAQSEIATENILLRALTYTQYFEPFFFRYWVLSRVKHHLFSSRVHIA